MKIVERLTIGSIGFLTTLMLAGMVAAPLVGSDKPIELSPVLTGLKNGWNWLTGAAGDANTPRENPEPFVDLAGRKLDGVTSELDKGTVPESTAPNSPSPNSTVQDSSSGQGTVPNSTVQDSGQTDLRLSICPKGSVEPKNLREISKEQAEAIAQSNNLNSWLDVQATLGEPVCNITKGDRVQWRFLVQGGAILDIVQESSQANKLKPTLTGS